MAKKNLSNLMSGMISGPTSENTLPEVVNTPSPEAAQPETPTGRRGRPRKSTSTEQDVRTTIILSKPQLNRLRYAAMVENKSMKDVMLSLIEKYLSDWERKHGAFPEHIM